MHQSGLDGEEDARALSPRAALQAVAAIYRRADAAYAHLSCPASADCCQLSRRGRQPWLWAPEWLAIREALARAGRPLPPPRADGGCPFLDGTGRRCTIYAARPFGCRTYFCEKASGGRHPVDETGALLRRLEAVSLDLDPGLTSPRPILEWLDR